VKLKKEEHEMKDIERMVQDMTYEGDFVNLQFPRLVMSRVDAQGLKIFFKIAKDYSSYARYSLESARTIICDLEDERIQRADINEDVCCMSVTLDEMKEFIKDIILFCFTKNQDNAPAVEMEEMNVKCNLSCPCYRLTYRLGEYMIPVYLQIRDKMLDSDIDYIRRMFFNYANEICRKEGNDWYKNEITSSLMQAFGIKAGNIHYLCECLEYDDVDEKTAIVWLKKSIDPEHLLRFRGFNCGYTKFKVYAGDKESTFTMVNGDKYFTIVGGNSTTCCNEYYWNMRDEIIKCIQLKLLKF